MKKLTTQKNKKNRSQVRPPPPEVAAHTQKISFGTQLFERVCATDDARGLLLPEIKNSENKPNKQDAQQKLLPRFVFAVLRAPFPVDIENKKKCQKMKTYLLTPSSCADKEDPEDPRGRAKRRKRQLNS
jgi:hypothetical protein